jgi:hypothetical protein
MSNRSAILSKTWAISSLWIGIGGQSWVESSYQSLLPTQDGFGLDLEDVMEGI